MSIPKQKKSDMHLHEYLYKNKIKHEDFARQIGVSRSTLHRIMTGEMDPRLSIVKKIEKATNGEVSAQDIQIKENLDM